MTGRCEKWTWYSQGDESLTIFFRPIDYTTDTAFNRETQLPDSAGCWEATMSYTSRSPMWLVKKSTNDLIMKPLTWCSTDIHGLSIGEEKCSAARCLYSRTSPDHSSNQLYWIHDLRNRSWIASLEVDLLWWSRSPRISKTRGWSEYEENYDHSKSDQYLSLLNFHFLWRSTYGISSIYLVVDKGVRLKGESRVIRYVIVGKFWTIDQERIKTEQVQWNWKAHIFFFYSYTTESSVVIKLLIDVKSFDLDEF